MTFINGLAFGSYDRYTIEKIIKILKEKNRYYKCRVCNKQYVEKEGDLCERCQHFADLKYKEKDGK